MVWIGLVLGLVLGGALAGVQGAVMLGFIGWLVAIIVRPHVRPQEKKAPAADEPIWTRVERLERAVARLETRLAKLEPAQVQAGAASAGASPAEEAAPRPMPVPPAQEWPPAQERPPERARAPQEPEADRAAEPPVPPPPHPIVAWLTGGNAIARVGLVVLFIGLAFLLKYAAERRLVPPELRVAGIAAVGIAMLVFGWRTRIKRPGYGLGLQGAGVAVLYLTTFAALRLYGLLPAPLALALLAAIAVLSAFLAVAQDSMILAAFGAGGGFLAPILASTGGGSHVMLFSYYLLLNAGIAGIAWYKAWRPLNLLGFLFTFFIGLAWGLQYYRPEHFESVEPFLAAFFVLYVLIAVLFARRQAPLLRHYVDGTLVFGVPLAAFGLQAALTRDMELALAFTSLAAAAFYLLLAAALHRGRRDSWRLLIESFLALGVVFATLAIPLGLDARWTAAAWGLEGAAIVWAGTRQRRPIARAFGLLLQLGAAVAYADSYRRMGGAIPLVDAPFLGALLLMAGGFFTWRVLDGSRQDITATEAGLVPVAFAWGLAWALFAGFHEIDAFVPKPYRVTAGVVFVAALASMLAFFALRRGWREPASAARGLLPALVFLALASADQHAHPFAHFGWIAWPLAFAAHFGTLHRLERDATRGYDGPVHLGGLLLAAALGAWELHWVAATYMARGTAWSVALPAVIPSLLVFAAANRRLDARWPITGHAGAYRIHGAFVIMVALVGWSFLANATHDGRSTPLPYLPLVNALDLAHVLAGLSLWAAWLAIRRTGLAIPEGVSPRGLAVAAGVVAFVWLNGVLLRSLHHWADIPYRLDAMARSLVAQAAISVFWSSLALVLMVVATRAGRRPLWLLGGALMAVVVVKLFVFELSQASGIERIVSFIGVGLLMLAIGWLSPVPPRRKEAAA